MHREIKLLMHLFYDLLTRSCLSLQGFTSTPIEMMKCNRVFYMYIFIASLLQELLANRLAVTHSSLSVCSLLYSILFMIICSFACCIATTPWLTNGHFSQPLSHAQDPIYCLYSPGFLQAKLWIWY